MPSGTLRTEGSGPSIASMATTHTDDTRSDDPVQINLWVPRRVKEELDEAAWRRRTSRRALGLEILTAWLDQQKEKGTDGP